MRVKLFSKDANPAVDRPLCHKSILYVDEQVSLGRARYLDMEKRIAQCIEWHTPKQVQDATFLHSALGDWYVSERSLLPREMWDSFGPVLNITTRQLATG